MFLQEFPDLQWLKQQAESNFEARRDWKGNKLHQKGWPSVILNVTTKFTYRDNIRGPFSLFTNLKGESTVEVDKKRSTIKEGFFFLSNQEQLYTLDIDRKEKTETFNIHFADCFVDQVHSALIKTPEHLLENPFNTPVEPIAFHNRLGIRSDEITSIIKELSSDPTTSGVALEEKLAKIVSLLLLHQHRVDQIRNRLTTTKISTREEILKRLSVAVDFIYANFDQALTLDEIASASCLSKFHFLRLFKIAYEKTPGQFLDEIRIQRGKALLLQKDRDVSKIAKEVGYQNSSSFSRMFRNQVGVYPTQFAGN